VEGDRGGPLPPEGEGVGAVTEEEGAPQGSWKKKRKERGQLEGRRGGVWVGTEGPETDRGRVESVWTGASSYCEFLCQLGECPVGLGTLGRREVDE
jgi:hypothetical protein